MRRLVYKKSALSQQQVLDAAIATMARQGVSATSIQDIANAAGLSKGAVHYHFENKDELLERVLERCCENIEARILAAFSEPTLVMDRVRRGMSEMWIVRREGMPEVRVLADLHTLARQNEDIAKALRAALQKSRAQVVEVGLKQLVEMGLRPKVPLDVAARLLLAALDGLSLHHAVDPIDAAEEAEILRALEGLTLAVFEL